MAAVAGKRRRKPSAVALAAMDSAALMDELDAVVDDAAVREEAAEAVLGGTGRPKGARASDVRRDLEETIVIDDTFAFEATSAPQAASPPASRDVHSFATRRGQGGSGAAAPARTRPALSLVLEDRPSGNLGASAAVVRSVASEAGGLKARSGKC